MTSIGETLRAERVRRDLDLQTISRDLKIPAKFLEAIEKEQFDRLPAAVFARSFVRQYARYLGLHEDDLVDSLQHALEPPPSMAAVAPNEKIEAPPAIQVDRMAEWETVGERRSWSSSLPALAMVVVVMLGCSGVYAWWQRNRHVSAAHEPVTIAQDQGVVAAPSQPPPVTAHPAAPVTESGPPAAAPDRTVAQPPSTADPDAKPPAAVPSNAAQPAAKPAGEAESVNAAPRPAGPVHVELTASALVWVFAKADGKTSFTGTLEPSQSRTIDAQDEVVLRLGNAGGADIKLNGKSIGAVGPSGQPRTVQLTSTGFQVVAPPKPPDLLDPLR